MSTTNCGYSPELLHIFSAHTFPHIREITRANELVFSNKTNVNVAVVRNEVEKEFINKQRIALKALWWWETVLYALKSRTTRVVIHGGYWPKIWLACAILVFCRKNITFISWGKDIRSVKNDSIRSIIRNMLMRAVISRFKTLVFLSSSDAEEADIAKPRCEIIPYYNGKHVRPVTRRAPHLPPLIQLGNDASPANQHIDCLNQIERASIECHLFIPLSYNRTDLEYIEKVKISVKRIPYVTTTIVDDMLSEEEFDKWTEQCDAFITGSLIQRGLYSAYTYLRMGKPLFIPAESKLKSDLEAAGFHVHALTDLDLFKQGFAFDSKNSEHVAEYLGLNRIAQQWVRVLGE